MAGAALDVPLPRPVGKQAYCMLSVLIICAALTPSAPYEDTQGRFTLTLAPSWSLAPRFGQTEGMRFARTLAERHGGQTAYLEVEAREQGEASAWADRSAAALRRQGHRVRRSRSRVGGRAGLRVRAKKGRHHIRCDYLQAPDLAFRLCAEGSQRDLRVVAEDLERMLSSFQVGGGTAEGASAPAPALQAEAARPSSSIEGRFVGATGTVFELKPGRRFTLGSASGTYTAQDGLLRLSMPQGKEVSFRYTLQGDLLTLTSTKLGKPATYRKSRPGAQTNASGRLPGAWQAGSIRLVLKGDGSFSLGDDEGKWVAEQGHLRLRKKSGDVVSYLFTVTQDALHLSGGDLDDPVQLTRARAAR